MNKTHKKGPLLILVENQVRVLDSKLLLATMTRRYMATQEGPLACERMLDVLESILVNFSPTFRLSMKNQMERWALTRGLHIAKRVKSSLPGSHNRPEFQSHRYPGISLKALQDKLLQFQRLLGKKRNLKVEQISNVMF